MEDPERRYVGYPSRAYQSEEEVREASRGTAGRKLRKGESYEELERRAQWLQAQCRAPNLFRSFRARRISTCQGMCMPCNEGQPLVAARLADAHERRAGVGQHHLDVGEVGVDRAPAW